MKDLALILICSTFFANTAGSLSAAAATTPSTIKIATFDVRQSVVLREISKGTRNVRLWISIPDDRPVQRLLNSSVVSAPGSWRVVYDRDQGNRFLYLEVANPDSDSLTNIVDFSLRRQAVFYELDPMMAQHAFGILRLCVEECIAKGVFRRIDLSQTSQRLWAAVHGITSLLIARQDFPWVEKDQAIDLLIDSICAGFSKEERKPGSAKPARILRQKAVATPKSTSLN